MIDDDDDDDGIYLVNSYWCRIKLQLLFTDLLPKSCCLRLNDFCSPLDVSAVNIVFSCCFPMCIASLTIVYSLLFRQIIGLFEVLRLRAKICGSPADRHISSGVAERSAAAEERTCFASVDRYTFV